MSKRIQDLATPFTKFRKTVSDYVSRPFEKLSEDQKFWLGFVLLCLLTTFLINNPFWRSATEQYKEGDVALQSIISPADITVTDTEATDKIKQSALESVYPIFTYESNRADEAIQSFRSAWESLARKTDNTNANAKANTNNKLAEVQWTGAGGAELGRVFSARRFTNNELDSITRVLRENAEGTIYGDQDRQYFGDEITLNDRQKPNQQSAMKFPESSMTALSTARNKLKEELKQIRSLSDKEVEAFNAALAPLIQPSVVYDSVATNNAREAVAKNIQPITISLKRS
ncbi:MAG: hypothetical protein ABI891_07970, partial [Acidobacteriota bacterium]